MARSGSFQAPPGFRDSPTRAVGHGEVVASTYAIRDEIARTDTGLVLEARDMMLDRLVALKLAWRDPGMPSLILEARRCAAVRDPCSVAIHGMGNHQGIEYVVAERVVGRLLADVLVRPPPPDELLVKFRMLVAAVTRAHEAGIAIGDISGATVLLDDAGRMVLGRLSLSQVPAFGPLGQILAPEVLRGDVEAQDPSAAEAIDLYGLGCIAIEIASGKPPFYDSDHERARAVELRCHATEPAPRLADLRADLPIELSDLVEWLLEKRPFERPRSARDVLAQLDAIIDRHGSATRPLRVLVVDDDVARGRWLWSLARRAHPAAQVEIAGEGTDAAHKLNRDLPDLVFVDVTLRGVMNAYELCMYARGLEVGQHAQILLIGEITERDRALFADSAVVCLADDNQLGSVVLDRVRSAAEEPQRRRRSRSTVSG
jgi:eukaryotic-like serine/threonine-protein kinase